MPHRRDVSETLNCFAGPVDASSFDRAPFKLHHRLLGHPSLSLEHLARVLPRLPKSYVRYAKLPMRNGDDFEEIFRRKPRDTSLEEIIENIHASNAYIMVSAPELDPSFTPLHQALLEDIKTLMTARGFGSGIIDAHLYLFIASPLCTTPFHIDRYSTVLLQFRGDKDVTVFSPWDERVVSPARQEAYIAHENTRLPWTPEIDALGTCFHFKPGEALHIPFAAGHHVKNGGSDVSISLSIIFNTAESLVWRQALAFNHVARRLGFAAHPVGRGAWRDRTKSMLWRAKTRLDDLRH